MYFHEHIQAFADKRGETYDQAFRELLAWYDSYQFSPKRLMKVGRMENLQTICIG